MKDQYSRIVVLISSLMMIWAGSLHAQIRQEFVIASIGGGAQTAYGSAYYTVGETSMIKTYAVGSNMLTQGFLQGSIPVAPGPTNFQLPVTLIDFTGFYNAGENHLEWQTATEINNDHFEVQRLSANDDFITIGTVKGAGTSDVENSYSLNDPSPMPGNNYYRLKQVDVDGNFTYSDIISIEAPAKGGISVSLYPNPTKNTVNIAFSSLDAYTGVLTVTDIVGKVVYQSDIMLGTGTTITRLDMSGYEQGQYFVKLSTSASSTTCKVVKEP